MQFKSWYALPVVAIVFSAILISGKQDSTVETSRLQAPEPESLAIRVDETSQVNELVVEREPESEPAASKADEQPDRITQLKEAGAVTRENFQPKVHTIALVPVAGSYRVDADSADQ